MNGGVPMGPPPEALHPAMQQALQRQAEMEEARQAMQPNKGEQRRIASLQFVIAARAGEPCTDAKELVNAAKLLDDYIQSGPNK